MLRVHVLAGAVAAGLLLAGPALPVAADGLSRFEEALREAPPGLLAYRSGKPLGDNGFVLQDVVVAAPSGGTGKRGGKPVRIGRITVEDFDFASFDRGQAPEFVKLSADGIVVATDLVPGLDLRDLTGRGRIIADLRVDYRLDPRRHTMRLNRLELDLHGLARIELSIALDHVDPDALDNPNASATLRSASLMFEDRSLLGAAVPAAAKARGVEPEDLLKLARTMLDGLRPGQGAATHAVVDALASYVEDYKHPKGVLRVTLNPAGKVSLAALAEMQKPEEAIELLGLAVSYPGTRPQDPAQ